MKTNYSQVCTQVCTLVKELRNIGLTRRQMGYLSQVMKLEDAEINELLDRAEVVFQKIKENL